MTRAPRRPAPVPPVVSPFEAASGAHETELANKLQGILDSLTEFDNSSITGILYKKPTNGVGSYEWIEEASPPFDFGAIFAEMKERFGGGQFELRVRAGGRIRGNLPFNIAREKDRPAAPTVVANPQGMSMGEMFTFMMAQQAEARRDQIAAAEHSKTLLIGLATALGPALIPLLARPAPANNTTETLALITALQDRKGGGGGLKDTLEAMAAFKTLMGPSESGEGGGGGLDMDDLVASGGRLVGPALKALGDYVNRNWEGGASNASGAAPPFGGDQLALDAPPSRYRILDLVRVDVVYGFERGHDPEKIAELVYDVIEANKVTREEIDELAAAFAFSPTGLDDLAAEGIDLRARPAWAAEFFAGLAAIHSEQAGDLDGREGRPPNAAANGHAGKEGAPRPADS